MKQLLLNHFSIFIIQTDAVFMARNNKTCDIMTTWRRLHDEMDIISLRCHNKEICKHELYDLRPTS